MKGSNRSIHLLVTALVLATWSCGSSRSSSMTGLRSGESYGAISSELAVRTFLDAVATDDYPRMWRVFGTESGPAVENFGIPEIEARMIVLARLLKNDGYELRVANMASYGPDRIRYEARMEGTRKGSVTVPILTVPADGDRWFVEQLDMDALTAGSLP